MENKCSPAFAYRKFLNEPKDNYPVTTFCIEEGLGIYSEDYLTNMGSTAADYHKFLSGAEFDEIDTTKHQHIDFDKALIQFKDIVKSYMIVGQRSTGEGAKVTWNADGTEKQLDADAEAEAEAESEA